MINVDAAYLNQVIKDVDLLDYILNTYTFPANLITIVDEMCANDDIDIKWKVLVSSLKFSNASLDLLFPNDRVIDAKYIMPNPEIQDFMSGPPTLYLEFESLQDAIAKGEEIVSDILAEPDDSISYSILNIITNNGETTEVYTSAKDVDLALENTTFCVWDRYANKYVVNTKTELYAKLEELESMRITELKSSTAGIYQKATDPFGWHEVTILINY
jgi:hypothetical protein